jgi:hypothetical protein
MRSYPKLMAAGLALAAAVGGVVASSAAAVGAPPDLVAGSAVNGFPNPVTGPGSTRLTVEGARSGPAGENPSGFVNDVGSFGSPMTAFELEGPVTCLRVERNKAAIKYRFAKATGVAEGLKGGGIEVFIEDNAPQPDANAAGEPQTAAVFNASATQCDDPNMAPFSPVREGGYTVADRD